MSTFVRRVVDTRLPLDAIIVIGSGALDVHGLREAEDIDLVATKELYDLLSTDDGWSPRKQVDGPWYSLCKGDVELWPNWSQDESGHPDFADLLPNTEVIEGVRFITLDYLYAWKQARGREKDVRDCLLIERYKKGII